jgi:hypothetical protein
MPLLALETIKLQCGILNTNIVSRMETVKGIIDADTDAPQAIKDRLQVEGWFTLFVALLSVWSRMEGNHTLSMAMHNTLFSLLQGRFEEGAELYKAAVEDDLRAKRTGRR